MIRLADDLRLWRFMNRLSQAEAASEFGVCLTTYSRWEREITRPAEDKYMSVRWLMENGGPGYWNLGAEGRPR